MAGVVVIYLWMRLSPSPQMRSNFNTTLIQLSDLDLGSVPYNEERVIRLSLAGVGEIVKKVNVWETSCHCVSVKSRLAGHAVGDTMELIVQLHPSETPVDCQFSVDVKGMSGSSSVLTRFSVTFRQTTGVGLKSPVNLTEVK